MAMGCSGIVSTNMCRIANAAGKTQGDICRDLNIGQSTVSSWFTGARTPRMGKIYALCDYFGVMPSEILDPPKEQSTVPPTTEEEIARRYRRLDLKKKKVVDAVIAALENE